jgi:hypothetical protein
MNGSASSLKGWALQTLLFLFREVRYSIGEGGLSRGLDFREDGSQFPYEKGYDKFK